MTTPLTLGLQLWSLRREFEADAVGTFNKVHGLGYNAVETAGPYGWTAAQWKERLAENKLTVAGGHIGDGSLFDGLEKQIEFQEAIGNTRYILPWQAERTPEGYRRIAASLNMSGKILKSRGASILYHNHEFEFDPLEGGASGYDILLAETDPALVSFQVDVYWVAFAGKDPIKFLTNHADRIGSVHAKQIRLADKGDVCIDEGDIDFAPIIALAREKSWPLVVEYEGENALEIVRRGADKLRSLGA